MRTLQFSVSGQKLSTAGDHSGLIAGTGVVGKIYYAQIYSGSNLVADMIPVKKSDGTLCLYDKVRKKYIYNAGTGTLKEG